MTHPRSYIKLNLSIQFTSIIISQINLCVTPFYSLLPLQLILGSPHTQTGLNKATMCAGMTRLICWRQRADCQFCAIYWLGQSERRGPEHNGERITPHEYSNIHRLLYIKSMIICFTILFIFSLFWTFLASSRVHMRN